MNWMKMLKDFPQWLGVFLVLLYGSVSLALLLVSFAFWDLTIFKDFFDWASFRFFATLSFIFALVVVFTEKEYRV